MIIDRIENASMYYGVNKRLAAAFDYLKNTDFSKIEPGKYEIDGSHVFALVQQYETKLKEKGRWEAHRKYMDLQYVFKGLELFGYSHLEDLKAIDYDEGKDFLTLEGQGNFFTIRARTFLILAPQDAHMPGIAVSSPQPVMKVVVKVSVTGE
ncbi:MAG: YhcH/YjgK/YiaL family protein [Thermodesulfobacteriota bacterium]|nr:YhcH/YjgK/YiaL family protein [Thermodesulfobacteriota bacterium]